MHALTIGFGLGFFVALQLGPMSLFLVRATLRGGLAVGLAIGGGIALVDALYAACGAAGAASLLAIDPLRTSLPLLGAAVLLALGARTLRDAFRARLGAATLDEVPSPRRAFATSVAATASNPATIASWAAIFAAASGAGAAAEPPLLVAGVGVGSLCWVSLWRPAPPPLGAQWVAEACGSPMRSPVPGWWPSDVRSRRTRTDDRYASGAPREMRTDLDLDSWQGRPMAVIERLDFLGVPTQDPERSRAFYREILGLRPDEHAEWERWAGETCLVIWQPENVGLPFVAQKGNPWPLRCDDVAEMRAALEAKGVQFFGDTLDTGVCHMAIFADPDGNELMLHRRYAPYE